MTAIIAHRGASYCRPENTLAAFRQAWTEDADGIEGDFRVTVDGKVVCIHDPDTSRVAGKRIEVASSRLEELREIALAAGDGSADSCSIPTVEEVLAVIPPAKRIYLEIKGGTAAVPPLARAIHDRPQLRQEQVTIISFSRDVVAVARQALPDARALWLCRPVESRLVAETVIEELRKVDASGVGCAAEPLIPPEFARAILDAGFEFHVWTVDDDELARRYAAMGALSITTNRPGRIRQALESASC